MAAITRDNAVLGKDTGHGEDVGIATHLAALAAAEDLSAVLAAAVQGAVALANARRAVLFVLDDARNELVAGAISGCEAMANPPPRIPLDDRAIELLAGGAERVEPDAQAPHLAPWRELLANPRNPFALISLRPESELIGCLLVEWERGADASTSGSRWSLFLQQVALSVRRARSVTALRRLVEDQSTLLALDETMASAPDFERLLGLIIERVKQFLDVRMGGLMLYDPETDELALQSPAFGATEEEVRKYRVSLSGGGNAVKVFRTGVPHMSNDLANDPTVLRHFVQLYRAERSIIVPVSVGDRRIGVFHVADKHSGDFTENDLRLVSLVASHLGSLLHNALLLKMERHTVARLQELNRVIDQQREKLKRTLAMHDTLTGMVLDGHGIHAIVSTLGRLLGNPVAVEDRFQNLLSYYPNSPEGDCIDEGRRRTISDGGSAREVHEHPVIRAILAKVDRTRHPQRLPPIPKLGFDKPRVLASIVVGNEILGYVYVLESKRRLDDLDFGALERAAIAIALEMMKEKAAVEARYRLRGDLALELLSGHYGTDELVVNRAAYLGLDLSGSHAVLSIDAARAASAPNGTGTEGGQLAQEAKLLDLVDRSCSRIAPDSLVTAKTDEIVVVAKVHACDPEGRRAEVLRLATAIREYAHLWLPEVSLCIGIGGCSESLNGLDQSYKEARQVLEVLRTLGYADHAATLDELGIYGVLFDPHVRDKLATFAGDTLGLLMEYDRRHGTELVETLDQYLRQDGHLEQTAALLSVHLNTLRYRLQRIEQIASVELRSVEVKFRLQLALTISRGLNRDQSPRPLAVPVRLSAGSCRVLPTKGEKNRHNLT